MRELWKPIPGFPPYEASNLGNIRRRGHRGDKPLKPRPRGSTAQVGLHCDGKTTWCEVGRLVLTAWRRPPRNGERAVRLNGSGSFGLANLKWMDPSESSARFCLKGEDLPFARFSNAQVRKWRERYAAGEPPGVLADEAGVTAQDMNDLVRHRRYASAGGPRRPSQERFNAQDARAMRDLHWREGVSQTEIARRFGCSASLVWRVVHGLIWPDAGGPTA